MRRPLVILYMTLQLLRSEFPYILYEKIWFSFLLVYQSHQQQLTFTYNTSNSRNISYRAFKLKQKQLLQNKAHSLTESIEWFIEGQAFSLSYDFAPRPPPAPSPVSKLDPATHRKTEKERQLADRREGEGGRARSRIIWTQKSLVLFKSFNTLCFNHQQISK